MNQITAFILLILVFPFLVLTSIIIVGFDGLPIFFTQTRIGIKKTKFTIYKFRTMKNEKITFLGRILRKTGIDELPQLINILIGNMNFIGPRPLTQNDINRLEWNSDYHSERWITKPGLTGLAQLSPVCNKKMSFFLDKHYAKNKSFILNTKIIYTSFITLFIGKDKARKIFFKK